jgi:benzoate/toluate 1,2-dioxygenase subunit beta
MGAAHGGSLVGMSLFMPRKEAEDLLYREARALDERRFDDWLAMFADDVEYWVPAWKDETTPTSDPARELSLIYYEGKQNLADRIWRLNSGLSNASEIPARVVHMIGNVIVESAQAGAAVILSAFNVHRHDPRTDRSHVFFGHYRHVFRREEEQWLIAAKKITLLNDCIPTVADVYML